MEEKKYFKKIHSDYLLYHLFTFLNLSDIRTLFLISKKFINILNKDNKKIIREIQEKIFGSEINNELILKNLKINKYNITKYAINKSPIINSILADNYLISTSNKFDNGFIIHDLINKKINQKISFNENNYSYVSSLLYIKEKSILFVGADNGYIIGYYFKEKEKKFYNFWEYKIGVNKEIKKLTYYIFDNKIILLSLDSEDSVKINFIRIFYIQNANNNDNHGNKYKINYIKSYVVKNYFVYNIKYFEGINDNKFFTLCLNIGEYLDDINNNLNINFKFDLISDNQISIISYDKIKINFNNIIENKNYLLNNDTYEELLFDYSLKGHKSYICDYLYLKKNNQLISVEYLSPYLSIWDLNSKIKINSILLPHTDSILSLINISDNYICSSGRDRKIFIYKINEILLYKINDNKNTINNYEIKCNHSSDIHKLNYYKDKNGDDNIISSSFDKTIKIFKMNENFDKLISKIILTGHSSSITCIKMDMLRKEIITIDNDSVINIWQYNKKEKIFTIKKSIELNIANKKKEYIDDIILLYDNLNSIIKIDKTKSIKIYSLSREEFLYEYLEKNEKILKIFDFCNFNNFICYSSNNLIKIYICKIQKVDNINYNYEIKNIKSLNIQNINFKEAKITCFKLLNWKYKLISAGYNIGKIVIIQINNNLQKKCMNINSSQYIIDINSFINNNKKKIEQIKCIEYSNVNNNEDCILYIIFSINNNFFIYSFQPNSIEDLKLNYINKIENKNNIIYFGILNRNIIISSFVNNNGLEYIYLPKYLKNNSLIIDEEPLNNIIQLTDENINKILYTKNKKGIVCILDNSFIYLEYIEN